MNRRELFAGAGAAALSAAVPVGPVPPQPVYDAYSTLPTSKTFEGLEPRFHTDLTTGTTSVWLVSWATGQVEQATGKVVGGQLYLPRDRMACGRPRA
jgi:hypothetical protein